MTKVSPVQQNEPAAYKSLGLSTLISELPEDRSISILDLGQPCAANVEFWSRFSCRIHIEDLFAAYTKKGEPAGGFSDEFVSRLLPFEDGTGFDAILVWDLFNYFDIKALGCLVRRLTAYCRPGTLLLSLISFQQQIPAVPTRFKILDEEHLVYEVNSAEVRTCPRHQPRDMTLLMSGFYACKSYLLRHGIQEYVFSFK